MNSILYTIVIYPITQILEFSFFIFQTLFRESGFSVIAIGFVISILCLPLYAVAEKWQLIQRETEKKLNPYIKKIKSIFKSDEQYMILSVFYRQNHYHPIFALRSSFGLLIQIPFFIAAYSYLSQLELLHGRSFFFIKDLSIPDALFSINSLTINILPIAMTFFNCIAGAVYTKGLPFKEKIQIYGMAFIFLILLYNSASALVLYWTINNVFSLLKNIYYRIQFSNKKYFLVILFSLFFLVFSFYFMYKYGYNYKGLRMMGICIFISVFPWIFIFFRKKIKSILLIAYRENKTLLKFLLTCFMLFILFGLFIPSQLIVSSPQEFSFIDAYTNPLYFLFNTALQFFGLMVFWPLCIYFLFSGNFKKNISAILFSLSICIIINIFVFPGNYGIISLDFTWDQGVHHYSNEIIINIVVLILAFFSTYILFISKFRKIIPGLISLIIISLLSISIINISKINSSFTELQSYYSKTSEEITDVSPLFSMSRNGKNVVIIMLDRAISGFIPHIFEESPELKNIYSGFTYYPNTVSFNNFTAVACLPLFGGYEYIPEEINKRENITIIEKRNESLLLLPRIFSENDYFVCVTDPPYASNFVKSDVGVFNINNKSKAYITDSLYTDIWIKNHNFDIQKTSEIIKRNMLWYGILRGIPLIFRDYIYYKGTWCSPISNSGLRLTLNGYSVLDYLPQLTEISKENINTLLIMTNNTTHENSLLQAPEYRPVPIVSNYGTSKFSKESSYHVNAGALMRIGDWIQFLKRENLYDNTRIIIVSDHGPQPNFFIKNNLPFNVDSVNPLLMVKDFNSSNDIITDMTFMTNADVPFIAVNNIIDNPKNPFTGIPLSIDRKQNPLYIALSGSIHAAANNGNKIIFTIADDFYVHDNIFIEENWIPASEFHLKK